MIHKANMITEARNDFQTLFLIVAIFVATAAIATASSPSSHTAAISTTTTRSTLASIPISIFADTFRNNDFHLAHDDNDDYYVPFRSDFIDTFSWELLKNVLSEEQKNAIISPFSVKLVLAILLEAAGNDTKTQRELKNTLTDIRSPENLRDFYKKSLQALKKGTSNSNLILNLATKLYTDAFIEPQQRYEAILRSSYDTDIERLDFANTSFSVNIINAWCNDVTQGRLKKLVNEDNVRNNVILMANAIYFNGLWRSQFNDTFNGVFFRTPENQIKVEYMEQTEYFYYHDSTSLDAKILRLPYKGGKISMFIVLPKSKGGLDELINNLENEQFKRMQWMMEKVKIKVTMPKFKYDLNKNLKDTLIHLGIHDIFNSNASLPGLDRGADVAGKLKVSNIFQKAGIEVNEKGTEAYASTVVEIENKFGGNTMIEEFNVNRPFFFIIEEETRGNLLFSGKVTEPFMQLNS